MNIENDHDEVLSLSDFPLIQNESSEDNEELHLQPQFEFDFHHSPSKQSEMRSADEIFFQGQIKPIEFPKLDYPRSESISSGSSSSSSAASAAVPRNLFHSLPSPSPRILSNERRLCFRNNCSVKKSWSWSFFRLGLMAAPPPDLGFRDLKTRCSGRNGDGEKKLKVKAWDFEFGGGCKCSVDAVDVAFMKRSASDGERRRRRGEEGSAAAINVNKSASNRTSEWLRQLSIRGAGVDER